MEGFSSGSERHESSTIIELLQHALSLTAAPSVLGRVDGSFLYANAAASELFGRDAEQLRTLSWQQITHPDDLPGDQAAMVALLDGESDSFRERKRYLRGDGSALWADLTVTCVRNGAGDFVCFWALIVDVDKEVQAAEQARESQAQLAAFMQAELEGHFLLDAVRDADGAVVDFTYAEANPAACSIFGVTREELLGARLLEVSPEAAEQGRLAEYIHVIESQSPITWTAIPLESSATPSVRFIDARITPMAGGVSFSFRDATQRVLAEQKLEESEQRLRMVLQNSRDVQLQADRDGKIEFVSPAIRDVLGWEPEDLIGLTPADFLHPDDLGLLAEAGKRLQQGDAPTRIGRFRRKDGGYTWIESVMAPVMNGHGQLTARIASWRDVSERVESAERLAEAEAKYRLLAENSSDAVFAANPDAVFTYISPSVTTLLGWQAEDIAGRTPIDFVHPDDVRLMSDHIQKLGSRQPVAFRARFRTLAGAYRWLSMVVRPVLDDIGTVVQLIGSWHDAEPEVAAAAAQAAEGNLLRAILDIELDPHLTMTAVRDDDGAILDFRFDYANDAALAYLGLTRSALKRTRLTELYPSAAARLLLHQYARTVETGDPLIEDGYAYPNELFGGETRYYDLRGAKIHDGLSLVWRDVTGREEMVEALAESEEKFRLIAENSSDVVILSDGETIVWVSPSLTKQLGWGCEEWIGRRPEEFIHPEDLHKLEGAERERLETSNVILRARVRDASGKYHWIESHSGPYLSPDGTATGVVGTFRVIDHRVALEEQLEMLARTDPATGLMNSREVTARIAQLSERNLRTGTIGLLFCDVDNFKGINDAYGHFAGDAVLRELANRLTASVRADDFVARFGGDELLLTLVGVDSLDEAQSVAEKIRKVALEPITLGNHTVSVTLSIGVTLASPGQAVESVIARADSAMYAAKKAGRNRVIALPQARAHDGLE